MANVHMHAITVPAETSNLFIVVIYYIYVAFILHALYYTETKQLGTLHTVHVVTLKVRGHSHF